MPYVLRDPTGEIISMHRTNHGGAVEHLGYDHPDIQKFLEGVKSEDDPADIFKEFDLGFVRVLEDLINLLVDKNVIKLTDLPSDAIDQLLFRQGLRSQLTPLLPLDALEEDPLVAIYGDQDDD